MIAPHDTKLSLLDGTQNLYEDIKSLKEMIEREISLSYGVPYSLLSEQNKYDSLDANKIQFLSDTIQPLGTHIEQSFNRLLSPAETALYCEYDYSAMLKSDPTETASYLTKLVGGGLYTINEARDVLGMEAVEGGDVPLVPANLWPYTPDNQEAFFAKAKVALSHNPAGDEKS
jgi:phage portal protein BeeE